LPLLKIFCKSLELLQADLDRYLECYNCERSPQGYRTKERPRQRALSAGLALRPNQEAA